MRSYINEGIDCNEVSTTVEWENEEGITEGIIHLWKIIEDTDEVYEEKCEYMHFMYIPEKEDSELVEHDSHRIRFNIFYKILKAVSIFKMEVK